jgi:hypothetical protein
MSTFTPSPEDIIPPETPKSNKTPLWSVILVVVVILCCLCLCCGVIATFFFRFGVNLFSNLLGGFLPGMGIIL